MNELGKVMLVVGHVWWDDTDEYSITNPIVATMGSLMSKHIMSYRDEVYTLLCESNVTADQASVIFRSLLAPLTYVGGYIHMVDEYSRHALRGDHVDLYTFQGDHYWFKGWLLGYDHPEPPYK